MEVNIEIMQWIYLYFRQAAHDSLEISGKLSILSLEGAMEGKQLRKKEIQFVQELSRSDVPQCRSP